MAISKTQKVVILNHLSESVATQKAVVVISTNGAKDPVNAAKNQEFRTRAREENVKVQLIKNTLIKKSFQQLPDLEGQTFLTYLVNQTDSSSEVDVPKTVVGLVEEDFKDNYMVLGSIVNGEFQDASSTVQLSKVPSFEDSMSMVAGSLSQVISKIARTVNELPSGVARAVDAVKSKKS